jgi:hypothetical protein
MTDYFLRFSDGSDASDGLTWANAKQTLAGVFAACAAGDTVFVSDNHAETQASSITLTSPGTAAAPVRVLCVDDAGDPASPTTLATTATITQTASASINFAGYAYYYGITFTSGDSTDNPTITVVSSSAVGLVFEECELALGGSNGLGRINIGDNASNRARCLVRLINTDVRFAATGHSFQFRDMHLFEWLGGTVLGTMPTGGLFEGSTGYSGIVRCCGVDFSPLGSNAIIDVITAGDWSGYYHLERCKLGTSFALTAGSFAGHQSASVFVDNCDSGDTNYKMAHRFYAGSIDHNITTYRSGGASDGTTPISWVMVASANVTFHFPLYSPYVYIWNDTTGSSVTVTAEIVTDNVTLTDAEAWIEIDYLGTSGFPLALFVDDAKANTLSTAANQTSSSVTWTAAPGTPIKQKLSQSFTPNEKGLIRARVAYAKASGTVYVCPKFDVT